MAGGIDWGAVSGIESGGDGPDWEGIGGGTAPLVRPPRVTTEAQAQKRASGVFGGGLLGQIGSFAHGAENFGENMGVGVYNAGRASFFDVKNHPASLAAGPWAPIAANAQSFAEGGHGGQLTTKVAEPVGEAYKQKYGAVFEHPLEAKSWETVGKNVEHDPFGTAMDALTLATLPFTAGGSAVLRGASLGERIGALSDLGDLSDVAKLPAAERPAALAKLGRTSLMDRAYVRTLANRMPVSRFANLGERGGLTERAPYTIDPARTPWGRALQRGYHTLIEHDRVAGNPIIGAGRFVNRDLQGIVARAQEPGAQTLNDFQKTIRGRSVENVAQDIASQAPRQVDPSDWLRLRTDSLKQELERTDDPAVKRDIQTKLKQLGEGNPKRARQIQAILTNPSRSFLNFYAKGRQVSEMTTRNLGRDEEQMAERANLPANLQAGMRWQPAASERFTPNDEYATTREAALADVRNAEQRINSAHASFRRLARPQDSGHEAQITDLTQHLEELRNQLEEARQPIDEYQLPRGAASTVGRRAATQSIQQDIQTAERSLGRLTRRRNARLGPAFEDAQHELQDARDAYRAAQEQARGIPVRPSAETIKTEGEFVGPRATDEGAFAGYKPAEGESQFGQPYAYSHLGPSTRATGSTRATLTKASMSMAKDMKRPDVAKLNTGLRYTTGRYFSDPIQALTRPGIQAQRWAAANVFREHLMDEFARDIPEDANGVRVVPKGWRAILDKPPRDVMERDALERDALNPSERTDAVGEYWKKVLPKTPDSDAEKMVPESIARSVEQEFAGSSKLLNILNSATNAWRYSVLKLRPAWAIRNILSQHFLYHLNNLTPAGWVNLFHVLRLAKGDPEAASFARKLMLNREFRSQFAQDVKETGVPGVRTGSASIVSGPQKYTEPGRIERMAVDHPVAARVPGAAKTAIAAPGNLNELLQQRLADDLPRLAQFRRDLMRSPARVRAQSQMLAVAKETDKGISLMQRFWGPNAATVLKEAKPEELEAIARQGQRILGNWSSLASWQKRYIRPVIPFFQFFKTMTGIIGHLATDSPWRLALLNGLEKAAMENPGIIPRSALPSWLKGSIALGPPVNGVQPMIDMQTSNHFNAPVQLAQGLAGLAGLGPTTDASGLMGPIPDALFYAFGINPATGESYKGTGSGLEGIPRAAVASVANLPQVTLAQQLLGGKRIPGTNQRIGKQYPSQLYANTPNENLFDYLVGPYKRVRLAQARKYAKEGR